MKKYTIVGSKTSPYVRRLRIFLNDYGCTLKELSLFDQQQRVELKKLTPILKIPVLLVEENNETQVIYDSRVIFNHFSKEKLSIDDENILSVIDGVNDSFVTLFLMSKSGINMDADLNYVKTQRERVIEGFDHLATLWAIDRKWDYPAISLFCLLDWANFRELVDIKRWPVLYAFWQKHQDDELVRLTGPHA